MWICLFLPEYSLSPSGNQVHMLENYFYNPTTIFPLSIDQKGCYWPLWMKQTAGIWIKGSGWIWFVQGRGCISFRSTLCKCDTSEQEINPSTFSCQKSDDHYIQTLTGTRECLQTMKHPNLYVRKVDDWNKNGWISSQLDCSTYLIKAIFCQSKMNFI